MNFHQRLQQFLYGRYLTYGIDRLGILLIAACCVLAFLNVFIRNPFIQLFETALFLYFLYRLFSRNIAKRQQENSKISAAADSIWAKCRLQKKKHAERQTHVYKTCPHCGVTLRLPRTPGEHNVICPRCRNSFRVKVRK